LPGLARVLVGLDELEVTRHSCASARVLAAGQRTTPTTQLSRTAILARVR